MTNEKINLDVNESIKEQMAKAYDEGVKDGIRTTIYYCPEERFSALDMAARNKGSIQPVSREEAFKAQRFDQKGSDNG